ncbi:MAG: acyl-CoA dehydrogenase [Lentisphaerae bacterium]|nr:acyl-CoA dehydrogenase [Lentisphaerota bacterium]OQC17651.1 MAG: Acyl-CoA dehydrogenase [Lentisphaerae bacterium ADurb.Bin082]
MPGNYYTDNPDLAYHLHHVGLEEVVRLKEDNFRERGRHAGAPADYADALAQYERRLQQVGALCGERIAGRAMAVDQVGATYADGQVAFAPGTAANVADLKAVGVMGVLLPRAYGGLNLPVTVYSMMTEMVSQADASLQNLFGLQNIAQTIYLFGDDEQKKRYLPGFASGEDDGAMALTEPEAGSDLQSVTTTADYDEATGQWRLNGIKHFITNGCAKVLLVLARSEPGSRDGRGLSLFIVKSGPGVVIKRIEDKLGIHGSPTCEVHFQNAPGELLGKRRYGLTRYVMSLMNGARLAISAQAVGVAEAARTAAWKYARQRQQFGRTLDQIPAVWEMLTRQDALTVAARTLLYETSRYVDLRDAWAEWSERYPEDADARETSKRYSRLADLCTPISKAFATEAANQVAYDSIQCHGGKGYMREQQVERLYRDARIMNIYEGTTQLQIVAAIGGLVKRVLDPTLDELAALPFSGGAAELAVRVAEAREVTAACLVFVESDSSNRLDLAARRLVRMATLVYVSYLLLRDAMRDNARLTIARRFIWEFLPEVGMHDRVVRDALP